MITGEAAINDGETSRESSSILSTLLSLGDPTDKICESNVVLTGEAAVHGGETSRESSSILGMLLFLEDPADETVSEPNHIEFPLTVLWGISSNMTSSYTTV